MNKAKKLILIGLDCILSFFIEKYVKEELMPATAELIEEGVFGEALPSPPCDTPTNWTTIVTGAWTGTHGMTSFYAHIPGKPLNEGVSTLDSRVSKAEFLWNVAERHGKLCVVMNYPVAWPPTIKKGIVIGGPAPGAAPWRVKWADCFANDDLEAAVKVKFIEAKDWKNLPESYSPPMETAFLVGGEGVLEFQAPGWQVSKGTELKSRTYYVLVVDSEGEGYDIVYIYREKDAFKPLAVLREGEWSPWIRDRFQDKEVVFRFKLLKLTKDLSHFRLYRTDMFETSGWSHPPEIAKELLDNVGPYIECYEDPVRGHGSNPLEGRWFGPDVWIEHARQQAELFTGIAAYLKEKYKWDIFIFHYHLHDGVNHLVLGYMFEKYPYYSEEKYKKAADFYEKCYKETDRFIKNLVEKCADEDTVVLVISDHGCLPAWKFVWVAGPLIEKGLLAYKWDPSKKKYVVDWSRTKAYPFGHTTPYVWINLKGRDLHGIVEPSEYDEVREEVIEALYDIRDPETGEKVMALVARKEDLTMMGQYGPRVGDVVYFPKPGYTNVCFDFSQIDPKIMTGEEVRLLHEIGPWTALHHDYLPTASLWGVKVSSTFIIKGPGVKKGVKLSKPVNLVDMAPTISYLLGLPMPKHCEGRILWEILE